MSTGSECKLILLGNGSVGKTSIIQRFKEDGFQNVYRQTIGIDFISKTIAFRNTTLTLSVWDIGGQSLSSNNLPNYIIGTSVIFLCYDVTDVQSFEDLNDWLKMIKNAYATRNAPSTDGKNKNKPLPLPEIYLLGNKIDLIQYRRINELAHDKFITNNNLNGGFFVSASTGDNVLTVFYKVAARVSGVELSSYELGFTQKVISGVVSAEDEKEKGKTLNSEGVEKEDRQAHEDVLKALSGNGGGLDEEGKCSCIVN